MANGRTIIIIMFLIGAGLLGGYELVRRSATPRDAVLLEDRGEKGGLFDRTYGFGDGQYSIREQGADDGSPATIRVEKGGGPSVTRPREGAVGEVHLLELEKGGEPTLVVVFRSEEGSITPREWSFRLLEGSWEATQLEPLPDELLRRAIGGDTYERQGAFLYRKTRIEAMDSTLEPIVVKLFYDFRNFRWVISD